MFARLASAVPKGSLFGKSVAAGVAAATGAAVTASAASTENMHPQHLHWPHSELTGAYDSAALRRGYEVYRQVCSTCHSMDLLAYRNLVGVSHTEVQAKALAESFEVKDGPNEEGEYYERPGRLSDHFNAPYPNASYARFANGGALPPDLSCLTKARHSGTDYVFHLITGYKEPPAGISIREGLHYNLYFPGGAIGMAPPLTDGQVEFEDGTPATVSQMAKDVSTFLTWCSEPDNDERKKMGIKWCSAISLAIIVSAYRKRFVWNTIRTRRITWKD